MVRDPRRREPPSGFRLEDATLKSMISEEGASFNCDIDRMIFAGRDESEQHPEVNISKNTNRCLRGNVF